MPETLHLADHLQVARPVGNPARQELTTSKAIPRFLIPRQYRLGLLSLPAMEGNVPERGHFCPRDRSGCQQADKNVRAPLRFPSIKAQNDNGC